MSAPTPDSRAPSFPRDYAAPASILHRRGGTFLQPLSGGASASGAPALGLKADAPSMHLPSAASMRKPPVARRQAGSGMLGAPGRPLDLHLRRVRSGEGRGAGSQWERLPPGGYADGVAARLAPKAQRGAAIMTRASASDGHSISPAASGGLITGPWDSASASSRGAASTLAGSQPVAVDAARLHSSPARRSERASASVPAEMRRDSAGPASFPIRHGAGSAAPRGRSIAGKDNGRTQARPELAACSTVQTQLAGAARPGPFPRRA